LFLLAPYSFVLSFVLPLITHEVLPPSLIRPLPERRVRGEGVIATLDNRASVAVNKQLRSINIYSASRQGRSAFTRVGSNRSNDRYNHSRANHSMIFASSVQNIDTDDTSSNNSNEVVETHTEQVWTSQSHRGLTYQESANWWLKQVVNAVVLIVPSFTRVPRTKRVKR